MTAGTGGFRTAEAIENDMSRTCRGGMNEPSLSLARNFEGLVSHRNEMSKVAAKEKKSCIRELEYKGTAKDRAYLCH